MSDKMREEFEAWGRNQYEELWPELCGRTKANLFDCYRDGWQASRASVVVNLPITVCRTHVFELPHTNEVGMEHDEYFEVDDIKKSLDAAGVKYE